MIKSLHKLHYRKICREQNSSAQFIQGTMSYLLFLCCLYENIIQNGMECSEGKEEKFLNIIHMFNIYQSEVKNSRYIIYITALNRMRNEMKINYSCMICKIHMLSISFHSPHISIYIFHSQRQFHVHLQSAHAKFSLRAKSWISQFFPLQ